MKKLICIILSLTAMLSVFTISSFAMVPINTPILQESPSSESLSHNESRIANNIIREVDVYDCSYDLKDYVSFEDDCYKYSVKKVSLNYHKEDGTNLLSIDYKFVFKYNTVAQQAKCISTQYSVKSFCHGSTANVFTRTANITSDAGGAYAENKLKFSGVSKISETMHTIFKYDNSMIINFNLV